MLELWTGSKEDQAKLREKGNLESRRVHGRLTPKQEQRLAEIQTISRRLLLQRVGIGGTGLLLGGVGAVRLFEALSPENDEQTYLRYFSNFERIARGDEEAEQLVEFLRERRKRGKIKNGVIVADEQGDSSIHFYTAIVDPKISLTGPNNITGFASYAHLDNPTVLKLKKTPIDPDWAGSLLGHEAVHVWQWLNGIEQAREDGFMIGEQEAYDFEFRLLDKITHGKFKMTMREYGKSIPAGNYAVRIREETLRTFNSLFNPPRGIDEDAARYGAFLMAVNFAAEELRNNTAEEVKAAKVEFVRGVFERKIPIHR